MAAVDSSPLPLLILSDGKAGHLNQSIALARFLELPYRVVQVGFRNRPFKLLSYLADRVRLQLPSLLQIEPHDGRCCAVVAAGSETYYACRLLAHRYRVPAVAVMLPRGYRLDFDLIIAAEHDRPPRAANIRTLPINLCRVEPQGVFSPVPGERYVGVVIGGPNRTYDMTAAILAPQLDAIFAAFPGHRLLVTTSRRTPPDVETLLERYPFAASTIYSRNPVNPIPDYLMSCDYVFITADSTSMISEAVSCGVSRVEVIPLPSQRPPGKYGRLLDNLAQLGCLHYFDGSLGVAGRKIDLREHLQGIRLCA